MSKKTTGQIGTLITCAALSSAFAAAEIRRAFPLAPPLTWLETDEAVEGCIALAHPDIPFLQLTTQASNVGLFFLRHLAPVQRKIRLTATVSDMEALCAAADGLAHLLDPTMTFAVQSRVLAYGKLPYRKVTINETLSLRLEAQTGAYMNSREPEQVVSILCTPTAGYLGVSMTSENLSGWPGGKHRFMREEEQISRAEFKLLEAVSVFGLSLPLGGTALDIGAAPGGWTRVLREAGLHVTALDPAELDVRLVQDPGVVHVRQRIQEYLASHHSRQAAAFSVIVNDLKMDTRGSVEVMQRVRPRLALGGIAVMTLKLPRSIRSATAMLSYLQSDLNYLRRSYQVLAARQLYHNRSEITVVLQRNRQ